MEGYFYNGGIVFFVIVVVDTMRRLIKKEYSDG